MESLVNGMYDLQLFEEAVTLCNLMEMVSKFYLKDNRLIIRSRLMKSLFLSENGFINESL